MNKFNKIKIKKKIKSLKLMVSNKIEIKMFVKINKTEIRIVTVINKIKWKVILKDNYKANKYNVLIALDILKQKLLVYIYQVAKSKKLK